MSEVTFYRPGDLALESMTIDELRHALARSMELSASHLVHLAAIWQELERRGEDMSDLRSGLTTYLPLIARGELNAHLVVRYAGRNMLLRHLAALPAETQERLVENDEVTVVDFVEDRFTESSVSLAKIDTRRLKDIVTDHILTPPEQRAIIVKRTPRNHTSAVLRKAQKGGRRNTSLPSDAKSRYVNVMMTDKEWTAFKAFASANSVSLSGFTREAIFAAMQKRQ